MAAPSLPGTAIFSRAHGTCSALARKPYCTEPEALQLHPEWKRRIDIDSGHCEEDLAYRSHRALYYVEGEKRWIRNCSESTSPAASESDGGNYTDDDDTAFTSIIWSTESTNHSQFSNKRMPIIICTMTCYSADHYNIGDHKCELSSDIVDDNPDLLESSGSEVVSNNFGYIPYRLGIHTLTYT